MFTLGVNYWPRKKAMYWWKDFDRSEVESEFAEIAALNLQVARIFLFWEDFQPTPDRINDSALADLGTVLDVAQEIGIKVMPTFFTGHMSGINWWPAWALSEVENDSGHLRIANGEPTIRVGRDPYADPFMLKAEHLLVSTVCARYGEHPAIYSWNLSNEPDLFSMPARYEDSASWNAFHYNEIRKYSSRPISAGMHLPTLYTFNGFRPDLIAQNNSFLSMHAYSIYYPHTAFSDPMNSDVVPLANLVTEALGGKPVLFEEFGYASSERGDVSEYKILHRHDGKKQQYFVDDETGGRYYREVLEKLARCGSLGAFAWMFSDYVPALWEKPPFNNHEHERFFGLTRYDGTVKPAGAAMRAFGERASAGEIPSRTIELPRIDPEQWYQNPGENFQSLFEKWTGRI